MGFLLFPDDPNARDRPLTNMYYRSNWIDIPLYYLDHFSHSFEIETRSSRSSSYLVTPPLPELTVLTSDPRNPLTLLSARSLPFGFVSLKSDDDPISSSGCGTFRSRSQGPCGGSASRGKKESSAGSQTSKAIQSLAIRLRKGIETPKAGKGQRKEASLAGPMAETEALQVAA